MALPLGYQHRAGPTWFAAKEVHMQDQFACVGLVWTTCLANQSSQAKGCTGTHLLVPGRPPCTHSVFVEDLHLPSYSLDAGGTVSKAGWSWPSKAHSVTEQTDDVRRW